jgi:DNA adenine methylase
MAYVEPFVGGGALFFEWQPQVALLSDANEELMTVYRQVRDRPEELVERLQELAAKHSEETYYEVRDTFNAKDGSPTQRAAFFIYLNKRCFNGLWRVNRSGQFNVPSGKYKAPPIFDDDNIRAASLALRGVELRCGDFETVLNGIRAGTFDGTLVYADSPYEPLTRTASFTAYTAGGFSQDDQRRLRDTLDGLRQRGCHCIASNSDTPFIRELYKDWRIDTIQAPRAVSCKADGRKKVSELVIMSY